MVPFMAAAGAVSVLKRSGIAGAIGGLFGGRKGPKERPVDRLMRDALAGSLAAAAQMYTQRTNRAETSADNAAYEQAWREFAAQRPDLALRAAEMGQATVDRTAPTEKPRSAFLDELAALRDAIRGDVATSVQRIGAGATDRATEAIAPPGSPARGARTLPLNDRTLLIAAAVVVAVVLLLALRK